MKKSGVIIILVLVMSVLSISVFAQGCQPEEDPCPGYPSCCPIGTSCTGPENFVCEPDNDGDGDRKGFGVFDMLHGFNIAENLLIEKVLFTLHIIKEQVFQTDLKIMEKALVTNGCDQGILSMMPKSISRYGWLNQLIAHDKNLIKLFDANGLGDTTEAKQFINQISQTNSFAEQRDCAVAAWLSLNGQNDDCGCPEEPNCGPLEEGDTCPDGCGSVNNNLQTSEGCFCNPSSYYISQGDTCFPTEVI